ncbi:hypothetical protein T10_1862, partial [Trichinella papuae]
LVVLLRSVFIGKPVKTDGVFAASVWRIHLNWLILSDFFSDSDRIVLEYAENYAMHWK